MSRLERLGAWLRVWTPPRGAVVPPPPWRKIAIGAVVALSVAGAIIALVAPAIEEGKQERAEEERRRDAAFRAEKARRLKEEGRPRHGRGTPAPGALSPAEERRARRRLVGDLERAITRDARARVRAGKLDGPVLATECEINPPSRRPIERDLSVRRAKYECLVVTSRDPRGRFAVGHSFEAVVDYRTFRFLWSKTCVRPGEGSARLTC